MIARLVFTLWVLTPTTMLAMDSDSNSDTEFIYEEDSDGDDIGGWSSLFKEKYGSEAFKNLSPKPPIKDEDQWKSLFFSCLMQYKPKLASLVRMKTSQLPQYIHTPGQFAGFLSELGIENY